MTELTPELIVDLATPQEVRLSPDGKYVVYTLKPFSKREEHPTSALWLAAVDASRPTRQFTRGDAEDTQPRWSPDGRHIAFLSDRANRGSAQLYLIAIDGGEATPLTPVAHKKPIQRFAWSPGGGHIAFVSADEETEEDERRKKERDDARVYGERLPYGRLRLLSLASREITTLVSAERHVAELCWRPDGSELAYVTWPTPDLESVGREVTIERIALAGGESRVVCHMPNGVDNLIWSVDGETLLCIGSPTGKVQSSRTVYTLPTQGGEPRRIAFGENNCAGDLRLLQQGQRVVASVLEGLQTKFCTLDIVTGDTTTFFPTAQEDLAAAYPARDARLVDGQLMLAVVQSRWDEPGAVMVGRVADDVGSTQLQRITSQREQLAGLALGTQEPFYWTAPDGLALDGLLVRPPEAPQNQPLPTVVLVHGGPYDRWGQGWNLSWGNWAQWLALAGYAVLMPNPRGGSGHGEQFAAAARGDVGGADYRDIISALDAAIERGIADPERLGIGGWSQGGFMSAWAVTQTTRFKAAVMGAGVSDWGAMVNTSDLPNFERELGGSTSWDGPGPLPHSEHSPISFARRIQTPVLILHGENDARVPLSQATGFHRALRDLQIPTEFVVYPREPHGIGERAHQIDILRRVRSWYDRWLRA